MNNTIDTMRLLVEERARNVLTRTKIPRFDILKVSEPTELFPEIYQPLVSLILQGEKRLTIGKHILNYTAGHIFIASVELPVIGEITQASATAPYLALRLTFDRAVVADLLRDVSGPIKSADTRSFCVNQASDKLADAWLRMLQLLEQPEEIAVMAPLLEREILFRLLRSPHGAVLRQVASIDSRFDQIRNALVWIRTNYATAFRIEHLADVANMSPSAFHRGFKASTGLSPLQYQKHLRLYEARRILFAKSGDVASVALAVGYESLSQFTREYARLFGTPPARDVRGLRANVSSDPSLLYGSSLEY
ncbi:AraC family transcriptional regulator [Allorhizobium sp. BGMRC 0089]|uniref:AraC family transcriptional regulator n=1 Tax=Allorhizobium sonneratiae TaxID=2934936 RepID=UPI00203496F8|nr:AraC family transcriptional regulator [Allorhizobium sonneratiae]MCM2291687.1 AraC family transcriptional regulator [Allorhizobium sonneratiae]